MFSDQIILVINITCITFLVVMMVILITATRLKGGAGWAALVIVVTTVPVYFSNTTRALNDVSLFSLSIYFAVTFNALCFPALWFFVRSQLDKKFRFTLRETLHLLPAVISFISALIYYVPMSTEQIVNEIAYLESGKENSQAIINDVILFGQFCIYNIALFFYVRRKNKFFRNTYADSDYLIVRWIYNFLILFFVLFFIIFVAYAINPRTDAWLIPPLNVIAMGYLVYVVISHSTEAYVNRLTDNGETKNTEENDNGTSFTLDEKQMAEICSRITDYLNESRAYQNPDLSLPMLSISTGISPKNISRAINGYLHKNFFDLINEMRVEEAKHKLQALDVNYTIDSVYGECGFRSRSTFFMAFKKIEGTTPAQWVKSGLKKEYDV